MKHSNRDETIRYFSSPRNIIIDLRALMHGRTSGVEVYIRSLLEELFRIDTENRYILFYNAFRDMRSHIPRFDAPNVRIVFTRIPNKLLNLSFSLFCRPRLDKLVLRKCPDLERIDAVFVPDPRPAPVSSGVRKITTFHDLSFERFPEYFTFKTRLWHWLLQPRREAKTSNRIIAVSKFTKRELEKFYGIPPEKISVIYHGISESFGRNVSEERCSEVRRKYDLPDKFFLFLSTIEPRKNISKLLEAFRDFKRSWNFLHHLVIAGVKHGDIFQDVSMKKLSDVHFPGFIEKKDKDVLYALSDGVLNVSLYEGFGLPVLEAMQCRVPVMVSDIGAFREVVGEKGVFVDPDDTASIVSGMKKLCDEKFITEYKKYLHERSRKFSLKKCAEETLNVLRNL